MRGKKLYLFSLFVVFQIFSAQFIRVNDASDVQSAYSPEDLIKKVLVGCSAANISNIQISNQPTNSADRAYGYFNQNGTNFPFKEGIVISTGFAKSIGNTLYGGILYDDLKNGSDADLAAAISVTDLVDASYIEFDFIPVSDKISFRYLFASDEYNSQPCKYDDGFALLLKKYNPDGSSTTYTNLAVLPNGDPVKVTQIHPSNNFLGITLSCPAINENYFGGYNTDPNTTTNFDGYVVPLIATATVIPNEKYHLKIVLADSQNYKNDSGVFLEAGSFNSTVYITGNSNICKTGSVNLSANTPLSGTYQWYKDGNILIGETNQTLSVSNPGNYKVVFSSAGCDSSAFATVLQNAINIANPQQLDCNTPKINLDATSSIYPTGSTFQWTATNGGNIVSGGNTLTPTIDSAGTYELTISGSCNLTKSIVVTQDFLKPTISLISDKTKICKGQSATLTASGATTYVWDLSSSTSNSITVSPSQTTTYKVFGKGTNGCSSDSKSVTVEVLPEITSILADAKTCNGDQISLDAGQNSKYTYTWFFNGNVISGQINHDIIVDKTGIYKVKIDNGSCSKEFSASVTEPELPKITNIDFQNYTLTISASGNGNLEYQLIGNPSFSWQDSNIFKNLENNSQYTVQVRIKGTSCISFQDYFTLNIPNVITPNGDGKNDVFDLSDISFFDDFNFYIYDRFGKQLFHGNRENSYWDGIYNGRKLPTGTYWYQLKYSFSGSETNKSGWILLKLE